MVRAARLGWLAVALTAALLLGVLTPVCAMASCDGMASARGCSDFKSACGDCPTPTVMKHAPDDAVQFTAPSFGPQAALAMLPASAEPPVIGRSLPAPAATASPPPLDPLGVRLTL